MSDAPQTPQSTPPAAPQPTGPQRTLPLFAICLVNSFFALTEILGTLPEPDPRSNMPPFPAWFTRYMHIHAGVMLAGVLGLVLLKRWGFLLTMGAYFSVVVAFVIAREQWTCVGATLFPLIAILSLQWKYLR